MAEPNPELTEIPANPLEESPSPTETIPPSPVESGSPSSDPPVSTTPSDSPVATSLPVDPPIATSSVTDINGQNSSSNSISTTKKVVQTKNSISTTLTNSFTPTPVVSSKSKVIASSSSSTGIDNNTWIVIGVVGGSTPIGPMNPYIPSVAAKPFAPTQRIPSTVEYTVATRESMPRREPHSQNNQYNNHNQMLYANRGYPSNYYQVGQQGYNENPEYNGDYYNDTNYSNRNYNQPNFDEAQLQKDAAFASTGYNYQNFQPSVSKGNNLTKSPIRGNFNDQHYEERS
ncbi:hypothetical protein HK099_008714 [Clydaea vesicula]|uniref:Uncharacterized protein n=1 Tax=Clydaea vesicula TaxID=447962 RepID=A0AAD5TZV1_9FUNG|nr:hypothetical protein HK099_008714 [Clydaea vesicula]